MTQRSDGLRCCVCAPKRGQKHREPAPPPPNTREDETKGLRVRTVQDGSAWAVPSEVITMPPIGSMSILSIARGPRQVRITSATHFAAVILSSWTLRPSSRLVWVSAERRAARGWGGVLGRPEGGRRTGRGRGTGEQGGKREAGQEKDRDRGERALQRAESARTPRARKARHGDTG